MSDHVSQPASGRIVVGVHDSPSGLEALRTAVAMAKLSGRELVAVRAFSPPPLNPTVLRCGLASWQLATLGEGQAIQMIERTFTLALGGVPRDVVVRAVSASGSPGRALVATAYRRNDLLVVGVPTPGRLGRIVRRLRPSIGQYCATHAACAVLTVPPPPVPRQAGDVTRHEHWLLAESGATTMRRTPATQAPALETLGGGRHDGLGTTWPDRACCCSAPPKVKVVLPAPPGGSGEPVDVYLCGHHYRRSLGALAIADAAISFSKPTEARTAARARV